jgi:hypothetical protein
MTVLSSIGFISTSSFVKKVFLSLVYVVWWINLMRQISFWPHYKVTKKNEKNPVRLCIWWFVHSQDYNLFLLILKLLYFYIFRNIWCEVSRVSRVSHLSQIFISMYYCIGHQMCHRSPISKTFSKGKVLLTGRMQNTIDPRLSANDIVAN